MSILGNENDYYERAVWDSMHTTVTVKDIIEALRAAKARNIEGCETGINLAAKELAAKIAEKIPGYCISCFDYALSKPVVKLKTDSDIH